MTLREWTDFLSHSFRQSGLEQPELEARLLLQEALSISATDLILKPEHEVPPTQEVKLRAWTAERLQGVPLAYLSGRKGFYKYDFQVERGVLVPRPETELVVTVTLDWATQPPARIADFGCGSGCIGLSLLGEFGQAHLVALDASPLACELARKNAIALGVSDRVEVLNQTVEGWRPKQSVNVIVANPPYIALGDPDVQPGVCAHEPHLALYSGPTGMEALCSWAQRAFAALAPNGVFVCEIGSGQARPMREFMESIGYVDVRVDRDLAGHDRVVSAQRP